MRKQHELNFTHKGVFHSITISPDENDWWTSVESHDVLFDIHFCKEYNCISVYEVSGITADYSTSIRSFSIKNKFIYND